MCPKKTLIAAMFLSTTIFASSDIAVDETIKVYKLPFQNANNITEKDLERLSSQTPDDVKFVKRGPSNVFSDENIAFVFKNTDATEIDNYNMILELAYNYAAKNIYTVDKKRLKKALKLSSIGNNQGFITKNIEQVSFIDNSIDFNSNRLIDNVDYFINNYFSINMQREPGKADKRLQLVEAIKKNLENEKFIDNSLIEYDINLKQLKELRKIIKAQ